jgi:hypothetical protein
VVLSGNRVLLYSSEQQFPDETFLFLYTILCAIESEAILKCELNEETISMESATVTVVVETSICLNLDVIHQVSNEHR